MYLLGYQAMLYVGNVVVSSPAGLMYDRIGFEKTYIIMGIVALTFTLISAFTLSACQSKRGKISLSILLKIPCKIIYVIRNRNMLNHIVEESLRVFPAVRLIPAVFRIK